jgi:hypothetical protein
LRNASLRSISLTMPRNWFDIFAHREDFQPHPRADADRVQGDVVDLDDDTGQTGRTVVRYRLDKKAIGKRQHEDLSRPGIDSVRQRAD